MVRLRRYLSRFLALVTALAVIYASVLAALAGTAVVSQLQDNNLALAISDLGNTIMLAAFALVVGTCAIFIAPHPGVRVYRLIRDKRRVGARGYTIRVINAYPHSAPMSTYGGYGGYARNDRHAPRESYPPARTTSQTTRTTHRKKAREKVPQASR